MVFHRQPWTEAELYTAQHLVMSSIAERRVSSESNETYRQNPVYIEFEMRRGGVIHFVRRGWCLYTLLIGGSCSWGEGNKKFCSEHKTDLGRTSKNDGEGKAQVRFRQADERRRHGLLLCDAQKPENHA